MVILAIKLIRSPSAYAKCTLYSTNKFGIKCVNREPSSQLVEIY